MGAIHSIQHSSQCALVDDIVQGGYFKPLKDPSSSMEQAGDDAYSLQSMPVTPSVTESPTSQKDYAELCERTMRLVDLRMFFPRELEEDTEPYRDTAHRREWGFHVSAPNIYAKALSMLRVQPGQSFLLIGSGSGYFSTIVGLLLGDHGHNYGVEVQKAMVEYAEQRVEHFMHCADAVWERGFARPHFMHGNIYQFAPHPRRFHCIYVSSEVQRTHTAEWNEILQMLTVGGRMVAPIHGKFKLIIRESEEIFVEKHYLDVAFAKLLYPRQDAPSNVFVIPPLEVPSLQSLCVFLIRDQLRAHVVSTHGGLHQLQGEKDKKPERNSHTEPQEHQRIRRNEALQMAIHPTAQNSRMEVEQEESSASGDQVPASVPPTPERHTHFFRDFTTRISETRSSIHAALRVEEERQSHEADQEAPTAAPRSLEERRVRLGQLRIGPLVAGETPARRRRVECEENRDPDATNEQEEGPSDTEAANEQEDEAVSLDDTTDTTEEDDAEEGERREQVLRAAILGAAEALLHSSDSDSDDDEDDDDEVIRESLRAPLLPANSLEAFLESERFFCHLAVEDECACPWQSIEYPQYTFRQEFSSLVRPDLLPLPPALLKLLLTM